MITFYVLAEKVHSTNCAVVSSLPRFKGRESRSTPRSGRSGKGTSQEEYVGQVILLQLINVSYYYLPVPGHFVECKLLKELF